MKTIQSFLLSLQIAKQALWIAFMVMPAVECLAMPDIARDREHHWVLAAQSLSQIVNYAIRFGFDELVRSSMPKLNATQMEDILQGMISKGYLESLKSFYRFVQDLQWNSIQGHFTYKFKFDMKNGTKQTTLYVAALSGHTDIVAFFLEKDHFSIDQVYDAVIAAIQHGHLPIVKQLFHVFEKHNHMQKSMLSEAIFFDQPQIVQFLLTRIVPDEFAFSMSYRKNETIFNLIVPFFQTDQKNLIKALEYNVNRGQSTILPCIFKYLDMTSEDVRKYQMVKRACTQGHLSILKQLWNLPHFAADFTDRSLLQEASANGYYGIVEFLLKRNVIPEAHLQDDIQLALCKAAKANHSKSKGNNHLIKQNPQYDFAKTVECLLKFRSQQKMTYLENTSLSICAMSRTQKSQYSLWLPLVIAVEAEEIDIVNLLMDTPNNEIDQTKDRFYAGYFALGCSTQFMFDTRYLSKNATQIQMGRIQEKMLTFTKRAMTQEEIMYHRKNSFECNDKYLNMDLQNRVIF